ncbi:MAG: Chain length determinant protein [Flavipsychrobacter sp.]|jgi:LPS O-antigen subunit length determinant protein (WzzB/FepE family)|nr:Chain length determinant protein [Flavipsychrobacter sp.]
MATPTFDLIESIRAIQKQKRLIIIMTVLAMALGAVFVLIKKKKYKAEARFLVNNPLYGDRHTLFRTRETRYVDYFGGDDDLDRVTALGNSDTVRDRIIRNCDFDKIYKFGSISNDTAHARYMSVFAKNFNLKRTEFKDIVVTYIAYEPKDAAGIVNMAVQVLEESFRHYYTAMKSGMRASVGMKVKELDSAIAVMTDTLANLRDQYGIYNIISPARQNVITGDMKGGGKGYGKAMEEVQNIESIKDQLVTDRAHYISLMNEYSATVSDSIQYLKVITRAVPPTAPTGPSLSMTLIVAGFVGLFFSTIYVLMMAYFRKLNAALKG